MHLSNIYDYALLWAKGANKSPSQFDDEEKIGRDAISNLKWGHRLQKTAPVQLPSFFSKPYFQDSEQAFFILWYDSTIRTGLEFYHSPHLEIGDGAKGLNQASPAIARLLTAKRSPNRKLIIFFHWWKCTSLSSIYPLALSCLKQGYDFLFLEYPYHLTRSIIGTNSGEIFFTADRTFNQLILEKTLIDNFELLFHPIIAPYDQRILLATDFGCSIAANIVSQSLAILPPLQAIYYFSPWQHLTASHTLGKLLQKLTHHASPELLTNLSFEQNIRPLHQCPVFLAYGKYDRVISSNALQEVGRQIAVKGVYPLNTGHYQCFSTNNILTILRETQGVTKN